MAQKEREMEALDELIRVRAHASNAITATGGFHNTSQTSSDIISEDYLAAILAGGPDNVFHFFCIDQS